MQRNEEERRKREEVIMAAELKLRLLEEEQQRQKEKQRMEQQRIKEEKQCLLRRENERYVFDIRYVFYINKYPANTRRCFDVDSTSFERYGRQMDVQTTLCVYWV